MRGIKAFNFPAFRRATKTLRDAGLYIISPHEMDEQAGYFWEGFTGNEDLSEHNFDIVERLTEDIKAIGRCDGVICLEGWTNSSGARAEASFAWAIGKPVYLFEEAARWNGFRPSLQLLLKGALIPGPTTTTIEWEEGDKCPL